MTDGHARIVEHIASNTTYISAGSTGVYGLLTLQEWVAIAGLFLGLATFVVNWHYKRATLRLAKINARAARDSQDNGR